MADPPALPEAAGLLQPIGDVEQAAVSALLNWVGEILDHDAALAARARQTKAWCDKAG